MASLQKLVGVSGLGSVEELAAWWVENRHMGREKRAGLLGMTLREVGQLEMSGEFRLACSEALAVARIGLDVEEKIIDRMTAILEDDEKSAYEYEVAGRFLARHAGIYRGDRTQVDHSGEVRVEFVLPKPEDFGYSGPKALAGVQGLDGEPVGRAELEAEVGGGGGVAPVDEWVADADMVRVGSESAPEASEG